MNRRLLVLALVSLGRLAAITPIVAAQEATARPSLAVADVAISPGSWTLPPPQLSATIIELLMGELVASQRFHVYDGQWLVPESEAGHANLDRLRAAAAESHVDYVVLGSLTAFSTEHKKKGVGGAVPLPFFLGGFSRQQAQLRVSMTFRIVDVRTGEVVSSASGDGLGTRRATGLAAGGFIHGLPVGVLAGAKLPQARDAMLNEAVRQAVHAAAAALTQTASSLSGS
jgi:curli biogenesis system outer membrane secretion channel CsgG